MRHILSTIIVASTALITSNAHADVTGGTIVSINKDSLILRLDDGQDYKLSSEFDLSALQKGMEVYISYSEINGENIVNDMDIDN